MRLVGALVFNMPLCLLAVRMSMPDFYEKMKNRLRTAEQGADTLVWLSIAQSIKSEQNGQFYLGMV